MRIPLFTQPPPTSVHSASSYFSLLRLRIPQSIQSQNSSVHSSPHNSFPLACLYICPLSLHIPQPSQPSHTWSRTISTYLSPLSLKITQSTQFPHISVNHHISQSSQSSHISVQSIVTYLRPVNHHISQSSQTLHISVQSTITYISLFNLHIPLFPTVT